MLICILHRVMRRCYSFGRCITDWRLCVYPASAQIAMQNAEYANAVSSMLAVTCEPCCWTKTNTVFVAVAFHRIAHQSLFVVLAFPSIRVAQFAICWPKKSYCKSLFRQWRCTIVWVHGRDDVDNWIEWPFSRHVSYIRVLSAGDKSFTRENWSESLVTLMSHMSIA